jgi:hypothetical protein
MLLDEGWCMKKLGKASSVFDLLDREKVWEWGSPYTTFEKQCANYLAAVTELGRPFCSKDRTGKWCSAYCFNQLTRNYARHGVLSPKRRNLVSELPYFFLDRRYQEQEKYVHAILNFVRGTGRLPGNRPLSERRLYNQVLQFRASINNKDFPQDLKSLLLPYLYAPSPRDARRDQQITSVKQFVADFGFFPSSKSKKAVERRLGYFIHCQRKAKRKGLLSESRIRALESIQGFEWDVPTGRLGHRNLR